MLKRSGILLPPHLWPPVFRQDLQGSACKADAKPRHCVWLALVVFSLPVSLVGKRPKPTIFLLKFTHYGTLLILNFRFGLMGSRRWFFNHGIYGKSARVAGTFPSRS